MAKKTAYCPACAVPAEPEFEVRSRLAESVTCGLCGEQNKVEDWWHDAEVAEIDDGGMAFPGQQSIERDDKWNQTWDPGMTLRDWLVGQAIAGCAFSMGGEPKGSNIKWIIDYAEKTADEYLRRRAERAKGGKA